MLENAGGVNHSANRRPGFLFVIRKKAIDRGAVAYVQESEMHCGTGALEFPDRSDLECLPMVCVDVAPCGPVRQGRPTDQKESRGAVPYQPASNLQAQAAAAASDQI